MSDSNRHDHARDDSRQPPAGVAPALATRVPFEAIVAGLPAGILVFAADGRVVYANASAARLLGLRVDSPAECGALLARAVRRDGSPLPAHEQPVQRTLATGQPCAGEVLGIQRADGGPAWLSVSTQPLGGGQAGPSGVVVSYFDVTEAQTLQEAVQVANQELAQWVNELEARTRELSRLSELGELLQVCRSVDEAYRVVAHSARYLFPGRAGAIFTFDRARNLLEQAAGWGGAVASEPLFTPDECWALRRGRPHTVDAAQLGPWCAHVRSPHPAAGICLPMLAQGEVVGLLHLQGGGDAAGGAGERDRIEPTAQQLAVAVAEQLALALSNVALRERLRAQALRDPDTGLLNRPVLEEVLQREVRRAARAERPLTVVLVRLQVCPSGAAADEATWDAARRLVALTLNEVVREDDVVGHYSADAFLLGLGGTDAPAAARVVRVVLNQLAHQPPPAGARVQVAVGWAVAPADGVAVADLVAAAERHLAAPSSGRRLRLGEALAAPDRDEHPNL